MTDDMVAQLAAFIAKNILKDARRVIDPNQALLSSGLVDSFSLMDLALFVEDTFGVQIQDTELNAASFDSLEQLAALIRSRQ